MKKTIMLLGVASLFFLSSCATIVSGSRQTVKFDSTPINAIVFIDETEVGKTPFETKLGRKREYEVEIRLEGYEPYKTKLTKQFNAWYIGNIVFGGIIGLVVDPITGAIYKLTLNEINAQLQQGTVFKSSKKEVYIAVSLKVDKNWQKVGQLEKL